MISTTFTVMILSTLVAAAPITITLLVPAPTSTLEDVAAPDPAFSAAYINAPNATLPGLTITMTLTETPSVATSTSAMWVPLSSESVEPATSTAPFLAAVTAPTPAPGGQIVAAYYPDWAGPDFPPEKIDFGRFDWIDFAFALPNEQFGLNWDNDDMAPKLLHRLVTAAHAKGKKVKLSVGGWTGSKFFSPAVASADSRLMFANSILEAYEHFHLDGIDIDWEYPGQPGNDANVIDVQHDTANFLLFLQLLRTVLPPTAKITAATLTQPWVGPDGTPLKDMTAFAQVLDWILIMNYDVWGSSATPGANAPLSDACGNATQSNAGAHASVHSWTTAGFPANQITLGLPSYGYLSRSSAHRLHNRRAKGVHAMDASGTLSVKNDNGGSDNGQIQFRDLVRQGALVRSTPGASDSKFVGAHGFERLWDECSSTPFLRSENAGQIITYDDPESLGLKADFARQAGLKGVNMFDVHGDTDNWDLIDAARTSLHNT